MHKKLTMIDLFAGAGGLSEGFIRAGFEPIAHVEMDAAACNTLRTRVAYHWLKEQQRLDIYEKYLLRKITRSELYDSVPSEVLNTVIEAPIGPYTNPEIFQTIRQNYTRKNVDLLIGGPPCQAYSLMGRSADPNGMKGDSRNYLFKYYIEFLVKFKPKYFVFENVTGLLSAKDEEGNKYLDLIEKAFKSAGYKIAPVEELEPIIASDYGVPQHRKRVIIIGKKGKKIPTYPALKKSQPNETISELFSDLPTLTADDHKSNYIESSIEHLQNLSELGIRDRMPEINLPLTQHLSRPHIERDLEIYRLAVKQWNKNGKRLNYSKLPVRLITHKNTKSHLDRFKVVDGDAHASHTVVAHIAKDGHYYIHPKQNRSISVREAARLQTFPDDYYFEGKKEGSYQTAGFKQIGNAVPVLLAQRIADALVEQWDD
jgi:DNA (cytosine-5)-methyltransferase 1